MLWVGMQRLKHAPTLEGSELNHKILKTSIHPDLSKEEKSLASLLNAHLQGRITEGAYEKTDFLSLSSSETS